MTTNVVISLDTRRIKKDGTYPLIMRLGHNGQTTSIPIGISIEEKYWDESQRIIRRSYQGVGSVSRLNNQIQKVKADAMDIILKLEESGVLQTLSVKTLRDRIEQRETRDSFFQFAEQCVTDLIESHRVGTARSYQGVIAVLKTFTKGKELLFRQVTYEFLQKFEVYHRSKGNGANGLAVYMRTIRAIYNKGMRVGLVEKELYPFEDYKIKTAPTEKRALDAVSLQQIINLDIPESHICFETRVYFLASYMLYGMNFADMAYLEKKDIQNGRIRYVRRKTGKVYDIKILPQLNEILRYLLDKLPASLFVFPILKRSSPVLREKDIMWARKRYNKKLKTLAALCGIESNLTSYVSRHSFATQAMMRAIPLNGISSMLGHSSLKTTEIYLKSLSSNMLDDYNERLFE